MVSAHSLQRTLRALRIAALHSRPLQHDKAPVSSSCENFVPLDPVDWDNRQHAVL